MDINNSIQYININQLYSHPDNPRKELGDLTELAASIKTKGIMQNLTVVKGHVLTDGQWSKLHDEYSRNPTEELRHKINAGTSEDGYTVIIGHRRTAAARLAGLTELPCAVVEMSKQEQVATMLLENIQRVDLTPYEQAHGMQMMLDLGDTVDSIADKTGFSKSTVRNRLKLMELDQDKLKKVCSERQLMLGDFIKLGEIEDIKERNKVLADIGTSNFNNSLTCAINKQNNEKKRRKMFEYIEGTNWIKIPDSENEIWKKYDQVKYIWSPSAKELTEFAATLDADTQYYWRFSYDSVYIYTLKTEKDDDEPTVEDIAMQELREKRAAAVAALREASERAHQLRLDFIKSYSQAQAKKNIREIIVTMLTDIAENYNGVDCDDMTNAIDGDFIIEDEDGCETLDVTAFMAAVDKKPEWSLLQCAYLQLGDKSWRKYYNGYYGTYEKCEDLDRIYDFLTVLGYEMSDEEIALQDGTSELFMKEEGNE